MSVTSLPWANCAARRGLGVLLFALLAWAFSSRAGNLQVAPIVLEFSPGQQATALWLENNGVQAIHAQIRVQQWSQDAAADLLEPTQALRASPAIIQVPAGQRQLVRIVRPAPLPMANPYERAYRVWVDELPQANPRQPTGLQFLLRYSIPVFVLPHGALPREQAPKAPLDSRRLQANWQLGADALMLDVHNPGTQRVRLSDLGWRTSSGAVIALHSGLLGYVLAGQHMQWRLPLASELPLPGQLQARLNDAPAAQPLPAAGR